jgi:calcineurin-like phosphoesterase family protein
MKKFIQKHTLQDFRKIHITSDMHFRHEKIKDFEPIREEMRIAEGFSGDADEYLIHKWNSQVQPDDLVINLGDLHWKSYEPIAGRLNGTMLLVLGNHDLKPQYYNKFDDIYVVEGLLDMNGITKE